jgi:hypothetical protein
MTSLTSHILNQQSNQVNLVISMIFWRRGGIRSNRDSLKTRNLLILGFARFAQLKQNGCFSRIQEQICYSLRFP